MSSIILISLRENKLLTLNTPIVIVVYRANTNHKGVHMKKRLGRPPSDRARKLERFALAFGIGRTSAYCYVNGSRKAPYDTAKRINIRIGGGVDTWQEYGHERVKEALFIGSDI